MSTLFQGRTAIDDPWVQVDGDQPVPDGVDVIVPLSRLLAESETLSTRNLGRLGVFLEAGDMIEAVQPLTDHLALIALDFPAYSDGRAFSKARLLHDDWGYGGEIRATGDVRIDQVGLMVRCGFTTLQITHQPTIESLSGDHDPSLSLYYQPAAGQEATPDAAQDTKRPWLRQRVS